MLLHETDNPLTMFTAWMNDAIKSEPNNPDAMCLATTDATGCPSARMVLLKDFGPDGFVFFTNRDSHKGRDLTDNPVAALCLYWKTLQRQVRIEGAVQLAPDGDADAYFVTRARRSCIGAWASEQSRPLDDYAALERRVADYEEKFKNETPIPRPGYWVGYCVVPRLIEFWQEEPNRLHRRLQFSATPDGWQKTLLYP